ncbi:uncharacterized protein C8R40DRAFT_1168623 [Lentinula edodes]|uniref:uncharacterized protein n=1 Tax=Lentinula edodes TaxID=5353 RepID=UPI001E8D857C|nr:uncharacterized protein C8R40DRAFT_1168623 [Lentinula edodes]KAH7877281.1 hypothetical protein C8R40DRAFT_1168623 [Lentinula edodes]
MALDVSEEMLEAHARHWRSCVHPHVSRICGIADRALDPLSMILETFITTWLKPTVESPTNSMFIISVTIITCTRRNGLIHGNLHPANIFITNDDHVNISEYSMFVFQHTSRYPQAYQYLSPESLKGADITRHAATTSLSPVYPSRFSVASGCGGPPAYELEEAQTPMSAPPTLQQFSFHRVGSTSSSQEIPPAAHYYSWYSSTAGSRVGDETGGPSQPSPPNTAPAAVQPFPANVGPPSPLIHSPSSYSWCSSLVPGTERSSGSSSSSRSVDTPITSPESSPSACRSRKGGSTKRSGSTSSFSNMTTIGEALPRVDSQGPRDSYTRRWELQPFP